MGTLIEKLNYAQEGINEAWNEVENRGVIVVDKDIQKLGDHIKNFPYPKEEQIKTAIPGRYDSEVLPDSTKALSKVMVPGAITLEPHNIRKDVEIYGVVGSLNPNVEPLYDFYEFVLPEEWLSGTKYTSIIPSPIKDVLLTHTEVPGLWILESNKISGTEDEFYKLDSMSNLHSWNSFTQFTNAAAKKVLITSTLSTTDSGTGWYSYDYEKKTVKNIIDTGKSYSSILNDVTTSGQAYSVIRSTDANTSVGLWLWNQTTDTVTRPKTTGYSWANLNSSTTAGQQYALIASTVSNSANAGLYLYDYVDKTLTALTATGYVWSIVENRSDRVILTTNAVNTGVWVFWKDRTRANRFEQVLNIGYGMTSEIIPNKGILFYGGTNLNTISFYDYDTGTCRTATGIQSQIYTKVNGINYKNGNYLFTNITTNASTSGLLSFNIDTGIVTNLTGTPSAANNLGGSDWSGYTTTNLPLDIGDGEYLLYNVTSRAFIGQGIVHYDSNTGILTSIIRSTTTTGATGGAAYSEMNRHHVLDDGNVLIYSSTSTITTWSGIGVYTKATKEFTMLWGAIGTTLVGGYAWDNIQKVGTTTESYGYLISSTTVSQGLLQYRWNENVKEITQTTTNGIFNIISSVGTDGDFFISSNGTTANDNYGLWFYDRSDVSLGANRTGRILATAISTTGAYGQIINVGTGTNARWLAIPGARTGTTNSNAAARIIIFQQSGNNGVPVLATLPTTMPTATQYYRITVPITSTDTYTSSNANCLLFIGDGAGVLMYDHAATSVASPTAAQLQSTILHKWATGMWNRYYEFNNEDDLPNPTSAQQQNRNILIWNESTAQTVTTIGSVLFYNSYTKTVTQKLTASAYWPSLLISKDNRFALLYSGTSSSGSSNYGFCSIDNGASRGADAAKTVNHYTTNLKGYYWQPIEVGEKGYIFTSLNTSGTTSGVATTSSSAYGIPCWDCSTTPAVVTQTCPTSGTDVINNMGSNWTRVLVTNEGYPIEDAILASTTGAYTTNQGINTGCGLLRFRGDTKVTERVVGSKTGSYGSGTTSSGTTYTWSISNSKVVNGGILFGCSSSTWATAIQGIRFYNAITKSTTFESVNSITGTKWAGGFLEFQKNIIIMSSENNRAQIWNILTQTAEQANNTSMTYNWIKRKDLGNDEYLLLSSGTNGKGYVKFNDNTKEFTMLTDATISATSHNSLIVTNGIFYYPTSNGKSWLINEDTMTFKDLGSIGAGGINVATYNLSETRKLILHNALNCYIYDMSNDTVTTINRITTQTTANVPSITLFATNYLQLGTSTGLTNPLIFDIRDEKIYKPITWSVITGDIVKFIDGNYVYFSDANALNGLIRLDTTNSSFLKIFANGCNFNKKYNSIILSSDINYLKTLSYNINTKKNDIYFTGTTDSNNYYIVNKGVCQKLATGRFAAFNEEFTPNTFISNCITGANGILIGTTNIIIRVLGPLDEFNV